MSCAHPACHCPLPEEDRFCSPECQAAGEFPSDEERDLACRCRHPDCVVEAESALEFGEG